MICVKSEVIPKIDEYASHELNIPVATLMARAGEGVFFEAMSMLDGIENPRVTLLCGCGNNAGDGYCAASMLVRAGARVTAIDVLGIGARTPCASIYYEKFNSDGEIISLNTLCPDELAEIFASSDLIIDAIFGTGARQELSCELCDLARTVNASGKRVLAVDVPLGVNATDGTLCDCYIAAERTVMLAYAKIGLFSYPAREVCGEIKNCPIGINSKEIEEKFALSDFVTDDELVRGLMKKRERNTHKGTYGNMYALCGSDKYRGAAALACHSALRMGAGIVRLFSTQSVCDACVGQLPEVIYTPVTSETDSTSLLSELDRASAILVGCGCGISKELYRIVYSLLLHEGCPLVLDADALNTLAEFGIEVLSNAKRQVIVTPHPAEMARLCAVSVADVQKNRINTAKEFSLKYGVVTVLKGASTIVTDGERVAIDVEGTPALAKGGSGDVLAGAIASLLSQGFDAFYSSATAVYLHSLAGVDCSREHSEYGVRAADLPCAMARALGRILG